MRTVVTAFLLTLFFIVQTSTVSAETDGKTFHWTSMDGPTGGQICSFAVEEDGTIYVGAKGVYKSTDNGKHWVNTNLPSEDRQVYGIAVMPDGQILAMARSSVYRSTDKGLSWKTVSDYAPDGPMGLIVLANKRVLMGGLNHGLYCSDDCGSTWIQIKTDFVTRFIYSFATDITGAIFASTDDGIFRSTNNGDSWERFGTGLPDKTRITSVLIDAKAGAFAAGNNSIYKSTDGCQTWKPIYSGADTLSLKLAMDSKCRLFCSTDSSVIISDDAGTTWRKSTFGKPEARYYSVIPTSNDSIIARNSTGGIFRSTDAGVTWQPSNHGLTGAPICSLALTPTGFVLSGTEDGISKWDPKRGWEKTKAGNWCKGIMSIAFEKNGKIYAGSKLGHIFASKDNGNTWSDLELIANSWSIESIAIDKSGQIFAGLRGGELRPGGQSNGGVYSSIDGGKTWVQLVDGLTEPNVQCVVISPKGDIFAGTRHGLFQSTDKGRHWNALPIGNTPVEPNIWGIAFANDGRVLVAANAFPVVIYELIDGGITYSRTNITQGKALILGSDERLYIGSSKGVYRSSDFGKNWESLNGEKGTFSVNTLSFDQNGRLLAGTTADGVLRLMDSK